MKSTPPPTLTKDCAFLSTVPSWTARLGAATSAFLALSPLQRQTSFLCTGSETFCSGFFVFCFPPISLSLKPSCYYFRWAALSVFTWIDERYAPLQACLEQAHRCKDLYLSGVDSVCTCCLYLKRGSRLLRFSSYTLLVDNNTTPMMVFTGLRNITPDLKRAKKGTDKQVVWFCVMMSEFWGI